MNELIILQGIPASGKSTWGRKWVEEDSKNRIIVNRDSIRRMLGDYWIPSREDLVSDIERYMVNQGLERGYSVCLDATNLNKKYLKYWEFLANLTNVQITYKKFEISLDEAIKRDKNREFPVGEKVIKDFYKKYNNE